MIYLNNAATSWPKPEEVLVQVNRHICDLPVTPYRSALHNSGLPDDVRKQTADFFHVHSADSVIFVPSATFALNAVLYGLLNAGDHIITTALEHNSLLRPLKTLEREKNIILDIAPCSSTGFVHPGDIQKLVKNSTRLIAASHASNVTGRVQEIQAFARIAHNSGAYFLCDASQSAGSIFIDMQNDGMDILVFAGHKNLFGLQGIGVYCLSENCRPRPFISGGTGIKSDLPEQPPERPIIYEAGTQNTAGIVSLQAGMEFLKRKGQNLLLSKNTLFKETAAKMKSIPGVTVYCEQDTGLHETVLSFNIEKLPCDQTGIMLERSFDIIVRSGLHCAPLIHKYLNAPRGTVRASFSVFNTESDAAALIDAVQNITDSIK